MGDLLIDIVPKRTASQYADGVYGPEDLAAIWNACRSEHSRAYAALLERQAQWPSDEDVLRVIHVLANECEYKPDVDEHNMRRMRAALLAVAPVQASAVPVAWMIEWDTEEGRKWHPRKGANKPRLDCFPAGTTAYPLYNAPQQASAVPDGWALVPIEPTDEMCSAPGAVWPPEARKTWLQMLVAAPQPKVQS